MRAYFWLWNLIGIWIGHIYLFTHFGKPIDAACEYSFGVTFAAALFILVFYLITTPQSSGPGDDDDDDDYGDDDDDCDDEDDEDGYEECSENQSCCANCPSHESVAIGNGATANQESRGV